MRRRAANRATQWVRQLTYTEQLGLAWLAGFIDGEGTIALSHGGVRSPNLRIIIYNTTQAVVDKVCAILNGLDVPYFVRWDRRYGNPCAAIRIGNEGALRLHPWLRPYLVRQADRYDTAVAFMADRYDGRRRAAWADQDRAEWERLRATYNRK